MNAVTQSLHFRAKGWNAAAIELRQHVPQLTDAEYAAVLAIAKVAGAHRISVSMTVRGVRLEVTEQN